MRILSLQAENFKRLRAVDITPTGDVVELRGANGAGKSSVLDAIWVALGGTREAPARPIRAGEDRATIRVDLGELVVTRRFSGQNSALTVEAAATGARYPSPQAVLDKLIGAVAFDPMEFTRLSAKEQLAALRRVVPVAVDLDALDAATAADYAKRTEANRTAATLRAQVEGIVVPPDTPEEAVSVDDLLAQLAEVNEYNRSIDQQVAARDGRIRDADNRAAQARQVGTEASRVREQIRQLTTRAEDLEKQATELTAQSAALRQTAEETAIPKKRHALPITEAISAAQATNAAVERARTRATLAARAEVAERQAATLTAAIAARESDKRAALAAAEFPVPNLSFGTEGVLLNDLPFDQASQAEKVRVSVALAMAANPRLRVLCVRDGSLLDRVSLAQLYQLVHDNEYQLWLEVTDDSATTGVIIEDGATRASVAAPELSGFDEPLQLPA